MRRLVSVSLLFFLVSAAVACGGDSSTGDASDGDGADGPPEGYIRLRPPSMMLMPGESGLWAQWVSAPLDKDVDVADVIGWQSVGGHHALLYTTSDLQPDGTTRPWDESDQLVSRFIGGIGGEGAAAVTLPAGAVFRAKKGSVLMIQTHYVNTTDAPILAESYLDVKLVDAAPDAQVASLFSTTTLAIDVKPGQSELTVDCVLPQDIELLKFANHMHESGIAQHTILIGTDGTETPVKLDDTWEYEYAFNPNFTSTELAAPIVLPAGATLRTTCQWMNTGTTPISFPDEMCVFFGMYLGDSDLTCVDGNWM